MIRFRDVPAACVETEAEAQRYADTLQSRVEKLCFWMWWACEWAVLGYDQSNRWDIRVGGECDCSSLAYWALWKAGYLKRPVGDLYDYTLYTGSLRRDLTAAGWTVKPVDGNPQDGWVLLNDGRHVAVWIGNGELAQASIDENGRIAGGQSGDQTGRETYCRGYYSYPWSCYLAPPPDPAPAPPKPKPTVVPKEGPDEVINMAARQGDVTRLYNPSNGDHVYTTDRGEVKALVKAGYKSEGAIGVAPAGLADLHRLYNVDTGEHILTDDLAEVQSLLKQGKNLSDGTRAGWQYEGVAFIAYADDRGAEKIHRLYRKGGFHLLTSDPNEVAKLKADGWVDEGVKFSLDA